MAEGRTAFPVDPDGWYIEPSWCTSWLLRRERFAEQVWDPACGQGNIVKAMRETGVYAFGSDIRDRAGNPPWFFGPRDFLTDLPLMGSVKSIVTNPPYSRGQLTEAFARRALELPILKLALFVPAKFLFSKARSTGFFAEHPPARVWPIFPRPSCPPGAWLAAGNKAGGGVADFLWLVWERASEDLEAGDWPAEQEIRWDLPTIPCGYPVDNPPSSRGRRIVAP